MEFSPTIENLIENFAKLPGVGYKTAERLAFHIIQEDNKQVQSFLNSIVDAKKNLKKCTKCFNISDHNPCNICTDSKRDKQIICVVEDVKDIISMEKTNEFKGLYHVLNGTLSPMNGIGPEDLTIKELIIRVTEDNIKEVILATNPKVEGETTAMYIAKILKPYNVKVTRIAHGIPVGGDLGYVDEVTLSRALEGRREI
ncbi:MAG: recombination mediator RecR [Clostridium sp.]